MVKNLGERIHPATGRRMIYVMCEVVTGTAYVADPEELDAVEWCDRAGVAERVPVPFFEPVRGVPRRCPGVLEGASVTLTAADVLRSGTSLASGAKFD